MSHHLLVRPVRLRAANAWIDMVHRHHGQTRGHRFSLGAFLADGRTDGR